MTELNDHLKLLFARASRLFDRQTAQPVRQDTPESVYADMAAKAAARGGNPRLVLTFPVELPGNTSADEIGQWLSVSGFTRVHAQREITTPAGAHTLLDVVADRFRIGGVEKSRVVEAIETAFKRGGKINVYFDEAEKKPLEQAGSEQLEPLEPDSDRPSDPANCNPLEAGPNLFSRYSSGLHCPESDQRYTLPTPSLFSFNSPMGACPACKGFGRVIGVDYGLVIPNGKLTLRSGAIKPMQTPAFRATPRGIN
jgi:excinuclease ABC subunit A